MFRVLLATVALGLAAYLSIGIGPAWATEYFSAIADLPVADGLTEQKDKSTVFDAPLGRIVTAYATGKVEAGEREVGHKQAPSRFGPGLSRASRSLTRTGSGSGRET